MVYWSAECFGVKPRANSSCSWAGVSSGLCCPRTLGGNGRLLRESAPSAEPYVGVLLRGRFDFRLPARGRIEGAGTLPMVSRVLTSPPTLMESVLVLGLTCSSGTVVPREGVLKKFFLVAGAGGASTGSSSGIFLDMSMGVKFCSLVSVKSRVLQLGRWDLAPKGRLVWLTL